ncbi:MAG: alpha/beta hydrolase family protein [Chloroflexota bacterium]|nr:MAG: alpha/beta hydrolase [Chloroflexota bacterium]
MSRGVLSRPAPPADVRLSYGSEDQQFGELRLPSGRGPHATVVVVHGGFWRARYDLTHAGHLAARLTAAGMATWNVEYRRIGDSGGGWPDTFRDVAFAADHVRRLAAGYPLDLDRIIVLGHSAGGHLALWLAARHNLSVDSQLYTPDPLPVRGAVSLAGMPDLRQAWDLHLGSGAVEALLDGTPASRPERYQAGSPAALLPLGLPQILLHGADDEIVPPVTSERYACRAQDLGDAVQVVRLPGAGHFELIDPRAPEWAHVETAVMRLLGVV